MTYQIECFDITVNRWYIVWTTSSNWLAHEFVQGRKDKGLRAKYRIVKS